MCLFSIYFTNNHETSFNLSRIFRKISRVHALTTANGMAGVLCLCYVLTNCLYKNVGDEPVKKHVKLFEQYYILSSPGPGCPVITRQKEYMIIRIDLSL